VTAYNDLNGFQFRTGKGYEKRSVEQFKAISLSAVDELLREVTQLRDEQAGASQSAASALSQPSLTAEEASLLARFRSASTDVRQFMLVGLPPVIASQPTTPPASAPAGSLSPMAPFGVPPIPQLEPIQPLLFGSDESPVPDIAFPSPTDSHEAMAFTPDSNEHPADEPEWLRSLNDEPTSSGPASSNWFMDDAFDGDVPKEAFEHLSNRATATSAPATAAWDAGAVPEIPAPLTQAPAWQAPPSVWDAPALAPEAPIPSAFEPASVLAPAPTLGGADGTRQIDDLFNQLDFGPPPAGVLAIAGSVATFAGTDLAPVMPAAPLHVDKPTENAGPLPAPTPPWSGWIQS
jgi:hypothetical protein